VFATKEQRKIPEEKLELEKGRKWRRAIIALTIIVIALFSAWALRLLFEHGRILGGLLYVVTQDCIFWFCLCGKAMGCDNFRDIQFVTERILLLLVLSVMFNALAVPCLIWYAGVTKAILFSACLGFWGAMVKCECMLGW